MNIYEGLPSDFESLDSLIDLLTWRFRQHPEKSAYTFLIDGEEETISISYEALYRQARAIGRWLQERLEPGERALLMHPFGLEYITSFWGCMFAGIVAVPAYPPSPNRPAPRIEAMLNDAEPKAIFASASTQAALEKHGPFFGESSRFHWFQHEFLTPEFYERWEEPAVSRATLALLQYTSGSTAKPKGVMVSHGNLLHNSSQLYRAFEYDEQSHIVSWLPFFHDMGLLVGLLQPVFAGVPITLLSPTAFLQRPVRWLNTLSRTKATISVAPNFAYDLCTRKALLEPHEKLDLSNWKLALNGSEPIRYETLRRFASAFAPYGFRWESVRPGYGLAENTLVATVGKKGSEPLVVPFKREALEQHKAVAATPEDSDEHLLVSCGYARFDQRLMIVNPQTLIPCEAGEIGEIWLAGPSTAQGYWRKPDETQQTFQAYHAHSRVWGDGPWLRTGDLGVVERGELFVTGRIKDLIIINGRNHYPQDIEQSAVQSHPAARQDCTAAFSLELENEEKLIIVQEIERSYRHTQLQEVADAIRYAISEQHDIRAYAIVLIKPASLPKTSSGKVQRRACRDALLSHALPILHADMPSALAAYNTRQDQNLPSEPHRGEAVSIQPSQQVSNTYDKGQSLIENPKLPSNAETMQFSMLYFSSNEEDVSNNKYRLLLESARFADQHDFTAVWLPERHFHPFGGLYPNPSLLASALAMTTRNIRLRAGSVVLPLHHPLRVVEEWSVVDNLSNGRVDLAFATGWNANDFVLAPASYASRKEDTLAGIKVVQQLWEGKTITFPNGNQKDTPTRVYPLPRQKKLASWLTCTGSIERFREAGALGLNVLTGLLFQSVEELAEKIMAYRAAREQNGYDPATGHVTLMMHTFIHESLDIVREKVRTPFTAYLESSVDLWRHGQQRLDQLSVTEREKLLAYAFERYFHESALFATPSTGQAWITRLQAAGVNEVACLLDFGVDDDSVLSGLYALNALRKRHQNQAATSAVAPSLAIDLPSDAGLEPPKVSLAPSERALDSPEMPGVAEGLGAVGEVPVIFQQRDIVEQIRGAVAAQRLALLKRYILLRVSFLVQKPYAEIESVNDLKSLGMDSLMVVDVIGQCQQDFNIMLDPVQFYERSTLDKLVSYIAEEIDTLHAHSAHAD